jgi:very-short-patch-repair endonuclease
MMDRQIIYCYQRGVASYLIAQKFGVSNTYVRGLLKKKGISLRGHNTTNKMSAAKRTPEENRAITQKAAEANLGSVHTATHRAKLALSRQANPVIDEVYERPLVDLCRKLKVAIIPQKAFGRFNVDLYLVKENVVIEIFGGGFHNKKDAVDLFNNKIAYLSREKIPVVIVWADKLTYSPENVLVIAQSAKERLTIINGDGTPTTRGLSDIILHY